MNDPLPALSARLGKSSFLIDFEHHLNKYPLEILGPIIRGIISGTTPGTATPRKELQPAKTLSAIDLNLERHA